MTHNPPRWETASEDASWVYINYFDSITSGQFPHKGPVRLGQSSQNQSLFGMLEVNETIWLICLYRFVPRKTGMLSKFDRVQMFHDLAKNKGWTRMSLVLFKQGGQRFGVICIAKGFGTCCHKNMEGYFCLGYLSSQNGASISQAWYTWIVHVYSSMADLEIFLSILSRWLS